MRAKRVGITIFVLLMSVTLAYAGEAMQEEALNRYNEGVRAQKAGDYNVAKAAYQKVMLLGSARADVVKAVYNNFGVIYAEMGNLNEAKAAFEAALNIDQDYKQGNFNLGIIYTRLGDAEKALEYVTKAFSKTGSFVIENEKAE